MGRFTQRSFQKEIMDDLDVGGDYLEQALKELRTINKLLGGNSVTTNGIHQFASRYPQDSYSIADIGCGGGDMIRVMHDWSRSKGLDCTFLGIDANPHTIKRAQSNLIDIQAASFRTQNIFDSEFADEKVDLLTCTLFTHHFNDVEMIKLLRAFKEKARLGIIINDLHRHPLAYYSIKILTRFFSRSEMVKNDGPLSVLRGFHKTEFEKLLVKAGILEYRISWNWAFRWQILCFLS
jgi:2-polyprenyl-3-methyl-5-hydroxy-6-metoxy-1,4-benzoquinol methylase